MTPEKRKAFEKARSDNEAGLGPLQNLLRQGPPGQDPVPALRNRQTLGRE